MEEETSIFIATVASLRTELASMKIALAAKDEETMKLRRFITAFVAAGGRGIEVLSGRQTSEQTNHLKRLALDFDLEISIGSDFHRDAPYNAPLGVEATPFLDLRGVWQRW